MAVWQEMLFAVLNGNTELSVDYFCMPGQVFEVGIPIEI
jgi:KUP system potassium uptake protein